MSEVKEKPPLKLNAKQLNTEAKKHLKEGAVTEDYNLNIKDACAILNSALASEILCVLRYRHHQIIAKGLNNPQVVAEFKEHAADEEKHMMMLAERINQLGGNPDFNPLTIKDRTVTEYGVDQGSLKDLITADLVAERVVISVYRKFIEWFGEDDPTTRIMLEKILKDEEDHANDLSDLLQKD